MNEIGRMELILIYAVPLLCGGGLAACILFYVKRLRDDVRRGRNRKKDAAASSRKEDRP